MICRGVGNINN